MEQSPIRIRYHPDKYKQSIFSLELLNLRGMIQYHKLLYAEHTLMGLMFGTNTVTSSVLSLYSKFVLYLYSKMQHDMPSKQK